MDLLKQLKNKLYNNLSKYVSHATLVEGSLKGTNKPFQCLFVENSNVMEYMSSRIYSQQPIVKRRWLIWIPAMLWMLRRQFSIIDMCIAVIPDNYESHFQGKYDYRSQEWVRQTLDVSGPIEEIKIRFHKNPKETARKVRKYDYSYKISHNIDDFEHFYNRMYLPLIKKQHGNLSYIDTYEEMEKYFLDGYLLLVMENDNPVSGGLFNIEDNVVVFRRIGVIDGDSNLISKGAQSAVYYFIIHYAKKNDHKEVDLMKSRPFYNDGVFRTKREWGASVKKDDEAETWVYYFIPKYNKAVINFFEDNPTVVCEGDAMRAIVGCANEANIIGDLYKGFTRKYCTAGLDGFELITCRSKKKIECH